MKSINEVEKEEDEELSSEEVEESPVEKAKPIGEPVRVSRKGRDRKMHF
jgi:hypothetical protein